MVQWMALFYDTLPLRQLSWLSERLYSNIRFLEVKTSNSLSRSLSLPLILCLQLAFVTPVTPVSTGNHIEAEAENGNHWDSGQVCVCVCESGMWTSGAGGVRNEAVSHDCKCACSLLLGSGSFPHSAPHICGHVAEDAPCSAACQKHWQQR